MKSRASKDKPRVRIKNQAEEAERQKWLKLRNKLGWSQLTCAIELGYSLSTIENMENPFEHEHTEIKSFRMAALKAAARRVFGDSMDSFGRIRIA